MEFRYRKIRKIGSGGMAIVYLAKNTEDNTFAALKVLKNETVKDKEYVQRFFREARIASSLDHPNIIRIIESGFNGKEYFIVTDFVKGRDLRALLSEKKLSLRSTLNIILKIVRALAYAHSKGIIHRDIKPSNILVDGNNEPRLCDFGIATSVWGQETRITRTDQVMGTMDYISPEQKDSIKKIDFRTDIYSVGVILYKVVTGRKPAGAFQEPAALRKSISEKFNNLIMKCLQFNPADRYKNADNLASELKICIDEIDNNESVAERDFQDQSKTIVSEEPSLNSLISKIREGTVYEKIDVRNDFLNEITEMDSAIIISEFGKSDGFLKELMIEAAGKLRIEELTSEIIAMLRQEKYCKVAALALGNLRNNNAEEALFRFVSLKNSFSYYGIIPLAGYGSVRKSVKLIASFLKDDSEWVRETALKGLEIINCKSVKSYIKKYVKSEGSQNLIDYANNILRRF